MTGINWVALIVLILLFALVTVMGFMAARWRRPKDLDSLHEWGLGGKSFGTVITWFLLGGDLYTAYTFIAVPAAMWATGAVSPGSSPCRTPVVLYPIIFFFLGRMWSVAHRHGYATTADIVQGRYGTRSLSLAVALTGILATMPYIALQLVGIQAVLEVVGIGGASPLARDLPLLIAFAVLAAYTYSSGLRAPAMIAFVKDTLIYLVIAVAVIYFPLKLGGWLGIFDAAQAEDGDEDPRGDADRHLHPHGGQLLGVRLARPGVRAGPVHVPALCHGHLELEGPQHGTSKCSDPAGLLPAARVDRLARLHGPGPWSRFQFRAPTARSGWCPELFLKMFPSWFVGFAFAAIAIGALVPAAIMSIAAANLFTRNIWRQYVVHDMSDRAESQAAKLVSLVVKAGVVVHRLPRRAVRHQPATARRGVDHPDTAGGRGRVVHALAAPLGLARRLGRRHGVWHDCRVRLLHAL